MRRREVGVMRLTLQGDWRYLDGVEKFPEGTEDLWSIVPSTARISHYH